MTGRDKDNTHKLNGNQFQNNSILNLIASRPGHLISLSKKILQYLVHLNENIHDIYRMFKNSLIIKQDKYINVILLISYTVSALVVA